ncbi:melanocortin-2 receptor accessory protein 2A [Boleophthalmus pectinirostris]|uniref:melanocortin-2 receptor accessory protein 2A n=1 Tax=Boleophthalmus pectinirostris TaxID=150288 RepID=UPI00242D43FE|nr:melanocortin-2 receptor accessory protein 2A [Boleophthalmus pectinirostris]
MTDFTNGSQSSARRSDYVWQYEYYDDEEPVSFEGLKAHRYSIVIGFWVGLAVFVIFMFFVLTLLTKTGAPHQDNPDPDNCPRPVNSALDGVTAEDDSEKAFSRPLLTEPRSYFHFYITEEHQQGKPKPEEHPNNHAPPQAPADCTANGVHHHHHHHRDGHELSLVLDERSKMDTAECSFASHFTIPNFVNLEQASALGEDELAYEPSATLEKQASAQELHCDAR